MRLKKGLIGLVAVVFAVFAVPGTTRAQNDNRSGSGLSISPTRTELKLNPGASDTIRISLRNVTKGEILAKAYINDFESDGLTGEPKINLTDNSDASTSIRKFLKGVADVPLKATEEKAFDVSVQIPKDTTPGAYYGIIRYEATPSGNAAPQPGQVALTASVATIVLIEVAGDIHEQVELKSLNIYRGDKTGSFFISRPDSIGVELANKGNGFAKPFGTVTVTNPLGRKSQTYELNNSNPRSNILPGSTRIFKDSLKGPVLPGIYQVTASVSFGNGGDVLILKKSFWYVPFWSIILLAVLILALAVLMYRLRLRLRHVRRRR